MTRTMTTTTKLFSTALLAVSAIFFTSCDTEDPGPIQEVEKQFTVVDFDRLEMGSAFKITVEQGNLFEVTASGDRRNIDDLEVEKQGSTLVIRYEDNRNRKHATSIKITMPVLLSANFSGASDSRISGFQDEETLTLHLSGASVCQLDANVTSLQADLSGASYLYANGNGENLDADLSGASVLKAFNFPVEKADVNASGASDANVTVSSELEALATGASVILYRGNPTVSSEVSGSSVVKQD